MFPDARSPSSKPGVLVTSPVVLSLGSLIPLLSEISFLCLGHGLGFALFFPNAFFNGKISPHSSFCKAKVARD